MPHAKIFFDLKDSKRVKINDLRLKKLDFFNFRNKINGLEQEIRTI